MSRFVYCYAMYTHVTFKLFKTNSHPLHVAKCRKCILLQTPHNWKNFFLTLILPRFNQKKKLLMLPLQGWKSTLASLLQTQKLDTAKDIHSINALFHHFLLDLKDLCNCSYEQGLWSTRWCKLAIVNKSFNSCLTFLSCIYHHHLVILVTIKILEN